MKKKVWFIFEFDSLFFVVFLFMFVGGWVGGWVGRWVGVCVLCNMVVRKEEEDEGGERS